MANLFVSVIIPTYNRRDYLKYCLHSLAYQDYAKDLFEVVIVDNGSEDGTLEMVKESEYGYPIHFLKEEKLDAFEAARMRNTGVAKAQGNILIFMDSDIIAPPNFISAHVKYYETGEEDVCVIGSVIYLKDDPFGCEELADLAGLQKRLRDYVDPLESDILYFNENLTNHPVAWMVAHSGNLSTTRACFEHSGGFDEWHRTWSIEDIDFGYSLYKNGIRFVFSKNAYGLHKYHPVCTDEAKTISVKNGYEYLQQKNPENAALQQTLALQLAELDLITKGVLLTEEYRRAKYKSLVKIVRAEYEEPQITLALYANAHHAQWLFELLQLLAGQFTRERPFEVIVLNGDSSLSVEHGVQTLRLPFDIRLFNLEWEETQKNNLLGTLNLKRHLLAADLNVLERRLLAGLAKNFEFANQRLKNNFEQFVYERAFGSLVKFLTPGSKVGNSFVESLFAEFFE